MSAVAPCDAQCKAPGPSLAEFEALALDASKFDHAAHLFVAWQYLREYELHDAIDRYRSTLRRLVLRLGIPGKYHESITWFFLIAVAERMTGNGRDDWNAFREQNGELFLPDGNFLKRYYSEERLASDAARRLFLLPDRLAAG